MLVLGRDEELDRFFILLEIDDHFDHHEPLKKVQQLAGLFANMILNFLGEMAMTGGYLDLHGSRSLTDVDGLRQVNGS